MKTPLLLVGALSTLLILGCSGSGGSSPFATDGGSGFGGSGAGAMGGTSSGGASGTSGGGGTSGSGGGTCGRGACEREGATCTDGGCCPCAYVCQGGQWVTQGCAGCAPGPCPETAPADGETCDPCSENRCSYGCESGREISASCEDESGGAFVWRVHETACTSPLPCGDEPNATPCGDAQLCVAWITTAGPQLSVTHQCASNPCGASDPSCDCASSVCDAKGYLCAGYSEGTLNCDSGTQ